MGLREISNQTDIGESGRTSIFISHTAYGEGLVGGVRHPTDEFPRILSPRGL